MRSTRWIAAGALALGLAGCGGDLGQQMATNPAVRDQAMGAIVTSDSLALQMTGRLLAGDSLRVKVVDAMLANNGAAQQVLVRIATNPDAMDLVLGAAVRDSAMRAHVFTLVKGMELASKQ